MRSCIKSIDQFLSLCLFISCFATTIVAVLFLTLLLLHSYADDVREDNVRKDVVYILCSLIILCSALYCNLWLWRLHKRRQVKSRETSREPERALDVPRTQPGKTIVLSPKQILGLDDRSYLIGLPGHECKPSSPQALKYNPSSIDRKITSA